MSSSETSRNRVLEKNFWLLTNSRVVFTNIAKEALVGFSLKILKANKLVTSNFKSGLEFTDSYYVKSDLKRFFKVFKAFLNKLVPFLFNNEEVMSIGSFLDISSGNNYAYLRCYLVADLSVRRYIERLNRKASALGVPFDISLVPYRLIRQMGTNDELVTTIVQMVDTTTIRGLSPEAIYTEAYQITVQPNISSNNTLPLLYRGVMCTPEILKVLKTISRKAVFTDEQCRDVFRPEFANSEATGQ